MHGGCICGCVCRDSGNDEGPHVILCQVGWEVGLLAGVWLLIAPVRMRPWRLDTSWPVQHSKLVSVCKINRQVMTLDIQGTGHKGSTDPCQQCNFAGWELGVGSWELPLQQDLASGVSYAICSLALPACHFAFAPKRADGCISCVALFWQLMPHHLWYSGLLLRT